VAFGGVAMVSVADRLADRTGMGEAIAGGVLLGLSTSLSGTVTSISAAWSGHPSLAISNAIGGIAVQTVFLVVADMMYRRVNLEHAAADQNNLLQTATLIVLLSLALAVHYAPPMEIFAIHPVSVVIVVAYVFSTRSAMQLREQPMWRPEQTPETRVDRPDEGAQREPLLPLFLRFAGLALVLGLAGYVIARAGMQISSAFGISETVVGAALTATATSLPELVTTLAAVRRGALQLAVGGIVGGNTFDVLFLSASDAAYREGSIYHAMTGPDILLIVGAIAISGVLLMGLIMRDRRGVGFEGLSILVLYLGLMAVQMAIE
jgi:cation:H+ antiporter